MGYELRLKMAEKLESDVKKLNPLEKLIYEELRAENALGIMEALRQVPLSKDDLVSRKNSEIEAAKKFFSDIGDEAKLKILDGKDSDKIAEALVEASERNLECFQRNQDVKNFNAKEEVLENVQIDRLFNKKSDVSFGRSEQDRWMLTGNRCRRGGYVAGGA